MLVELHKFHANTEFFQIVFLLEINSIPKPNYWRSSSYFTWFAIHVNLDDLIAAYTLAGLQCMVRLRVMSSWLQGLTAQAGANHQQA